MSITMTTFTMTMTVTMTMIYYLGSARSKMDWTCLLAIRPRQKNVQLKVVLTLILWGKIIDKYCIYIYIIYIAYYSVGKAESDGGGDDGSGGAEAA